MREQRLGKGVAVRKARKAGEALEPVAIGRQRMGLLVGHHLEAVLDDTQKAVRAVEIGARLDINPAALRESLQRRQRLPLAQFRMPAARDQLLGLDEELDLADAAAPELDVVALDRDGVVAAIGMDLPLHRVDVGHSGEIEILAPDERREIPEQRFAGRDIASTRPRLDQRGALPVHSDALIIVQRRCGRDGDLGRGRIRP